MVLQQMKLESYSSPDTHVSLLIVYVKMALREL
jgi:hypothetical protein